MSLYQSQTSEILNELTRTWFVKFKTYSVSEDTILKTRLEIDLQTILSILKRPGSIHWYRKSESKGIYILCEDEKLMKYYVRAKVGVSKQPSIKVYQSTSYTNLLNCAMSRTAYHLYVL
jgi:hypothetical protein